MDESEQLAENRTNTVAMEELSFSSHGRADDDTSSSSASDWDDSYSEDEDDDSSCSSSSEFSSYCASSSSESCSIASDDESSSEDEEDEEMDCDDGVDTSPSLHDYEDDSEKSDDWNYNRNRNCFFNDDCIIRFYAEVTVHQTLCRNDYTPEEKVACFMSAKEKKAHSHQQCKDTFRMECWMEETAKTRQLRIKRSKQEAQDVGFVARGLHQLTDAGYERMNDIKNKCVEAVLKEQESQRRAWEDSEAKVDRVSGQEEREERKDEPSESLWKRQSKRRQSVRKQWGWDRMARISLQNSRGSIVEALKIGKRDAQEALKIHIRHAQQDSADFEARDQRPSESASISYLVKKKGEEPTEGATLQQEKKRRGGSTARSPGPSIRKGSTTIPTTITMTSASVDGKNLQEPSKEMAVVGLNGSVAPPFTTAAAIIGANGEVQEKDDSPDHRKSSSSKTDLPAPLLEYLEILSVDSDSTLAGGDDRTKLATTWTDEDEERSTLTVQRFQREEKLHPMVAIKGTASIVVTDESIKKEQKLASSSAKMIATAIDDAVPSQSLPRDIIRAE